MPFKKYLLAALSLAAFTSFAVAAGDVDEATPYDLIRPIYPLTWDSTVFDSFDTTVTVKHNMVPKNRTPASYVPNTYVPDTLNQAYLDAMNTRISPIRVNQAGYLEKDPEKQFFYVGDATAFEVVDIEGKSLDPKVTGTFEPSTTTTSTSWRIVAGTNAATQDKKRYEVNFTGPSGTVQIGHIPPGVPTKTRLRIKVGNDISSTFIISDEVYSMVRDAALKFYGINRSGNSESWFHPASHTLDGGASSDSGVYSFDQSLAGSLAGGYYDCGDHLKESQTQMFALAVSAVMAATNPNADQDVYAFNQGKTVNTDGIPDMLREAKHAADFVLKAYVRAKGVIDDMALSVGDFGADHGWWGRPESQDKLPMDPSKGDPALRRGGPLSRWVRMGEIGSAVAGETAAGLAILGKDFAEYDKPFADSCLMVAKKMYEFGKNIALGKTEQYTHNKNPIINTPAYNGSTIYHDDMALAAVGLFYATKDTAYLYDIAENPALRGGQSKLDFAYGNPQGFFRGGWFTFKQAGFFKDGANTDWASTFTFALYAFYKLILKDEATAASYGISNDRRLEYAEDIAYTMSTNVSAVSYTDGATESIVLPKGGGWTSDGTVKYEPIWYTMKTQQPWIYNRYQLGNTIDVLTYADVTKDLEGVALPQAGVQNWKSDQMFQLGINQLNYMLGMNPWDISFIYGIGDKNDAHPHHRAANPEGKNMPGAAYKYRPPVGALLGGVRADQPWDPEGRGGASGTSWEGYTISETCLDASAVLVGSTMLVAQEFDRTEAPGINVEIRHVDVDSAIVVVKLTKRGTTTIYYGTSEAVMTEIAVPDSNAAGVFHQVILRGLQPGTEYFFYVVGQNAYNPDNMTAKYLVDSTKTPFTFTTLNTLESAQITNVTVCNLFGDSAEVMWYTPNGEYESRIYWDTVPHTNASEYAFNSGAGNADVSGIPTKFHYVRIGGLKEQTTYYYMVESNGQFVNKNEKTGEMLKFTTPVMWYDFSVRAYQYMDNGLDALDLNIYNNESRPFDSLELRLYFTATPEEVENCAFLVDTDILQAYDESGFNHPLLDKDGNDVGNTVRMLMRNAQPVPLNDTYDASTGKKSYYFPVPLGPAEMKSASRIRLDFDFSYGLTNDGVHCETLRQRQKKKLDVSTGDWSWAPHKFLEDGADYDGMPVEGKDYGDADTDIPINQFITVYRKNEFIWGYSPSYQEMTKKRAHYEMEVTLDKPFDVSDGSYVQIDQTSSTVYVTGYAHVSEQGYITRIWANGNEIKTTINRIGDEIFLISDNSEVIAHYNVERGNGPIDSTGLWTLRIPVKMKIGSNKIDLTIFAGANPECEECAENGGCAFTNRTFYVQFTRGNLTASSLTIKDEAGNPVASPADPANTRFYIYLTDKDKAKTSSPIDVLVINGKKNDTLKVRMVEDASNPGYFKSAAAITATSIAPEARGGNQISFFAGDTIQVIYADPDDEEDVSRQTFFAESKYPEPQKVLATDSDCDNVADKLVVEFTNTLSSEYSFDSIRVYLPGMTDTMTLKVDPAAALNKTAVVVDLPATLGIEATAAPTGAATVYLKAEGATNAQKIAVSDGILPQLLSVTILENPNHENPEDQLMVAFTEPVILSSENTWLLEVLGVTGAAINVEGRATTTNDGKSWRYKVTGNTDGMILKEGATVTVKPNSVSDKNFNLLDPTAACQQVKIVETPAPVPVTFAEMRDNEGDGYPDELYMKFKRKLRDKDMLDSFVVIWGAKSETKSLLPEWEHTFELSERWEKSSKVDSSGATPVVIVDSVLVSDTVSVITVHMTPANSFAKGATSGPFDGYGRVTPRLGPEGGFFDTSYVVLDKCPPIIMSAVWQGTDKDDETYGSLDYVSLVFSEPLDTTGLPYVVERHREGEMNMYFSPMQNPNLSILHTPRSTLARLGYRHKYAEAIWIADSVRLVPDPSTSYFKDLAGLYAGYATPWVPVTGSVSKIKFTISAVDGVTKARSKDSVYYGGLPIGENFRLTGLNRNNETVIVAAGDSKLHDVFSSPIKNYRHGGPVFMIEVALPDVRDSTERGEAKRNYDIKLEMDLFTNLGTFVNRTSYKFNSASVMEFISASSTLTLYLEWCAPEDYPVSSKDKKIGTGPYIAKFMTDAKSEYLPTTPAEGDRTETFKDSDTFTKTFGFRRGKK